MRPIETKQKAKLDGVGLRTVIGEAADLYLFVLATQSHTSSRSAISTKSSCAFHATQSHT